MRPVYVSAHISGWNTCVRLVGTWGDGAHKTLIRRRYFRNVDQAKHIAFRWLDEAAHEVGHPIEARGKAAQWAAASGWRVA